MDSSNFLDFDTLPQGTVNPQHLYRIDQHPYPMAYASSTDLHTQAQAQAQAQSYVNATEVKAVDSGVDLPNMSDMAPPSRPVSYPPTQVSSWIRPNLDITTHTSPSHSGFFLESGFSTAASSPQDYVFSSFNSPTENPFNFASGNSPDSFNEQTQLVQPLLDTVDSSSLNAATPHVTPQATPQAAVPDLLLAAAPTVQMTTDRTKTRAETQIAVTLTVDPLADVEHICFPRKTLAKPKQFANADEKADFEAGQRGSVLHMDTLLLCATAVEKPADQKRALRRAAGLELQPRRAPGSALSDLDRDDPCHPQNGGEVIICEGCKERERKRFDRKKKRCDDEDEFSRYESERVIMINEKEYKRMDDVVSKDSKSSGNENSFSSAAKRVRFNMRIACYCRHQEEKTPAGFRVVFSFFDAARQLVAQHLSPVLHITDDHKNKEGAVVEPHAAARPSKFDLHHHHEAVVPSVTAASPYAYPMFSGNPMPQVTNNTYSFQALPFHPPPAPVVSNALPVYPSYPIASAPTTTITQYTRHQRGLSYMDLSALNAQQQQHQQLQAAVAAAVTTPPDVTRGLPRPQSVDGFNYAALQEEAFAAAEYPNSWFASAPPTVNSTPVNLSRPPSPTWVSGAAGPTGKKMRCS